MGTSVYGQSGVSIRCESTNRGDIELICQRHVEGQGVGSPSGAAARVAQRFLQKHPPSAILFGVVNHGDNWHPLIQPVYHVTPIQSNYNALLAGNNSEGIGRLQLKFHDAVLDSSAF